MLLPGHETTATGLALRLRPADARAACAGAGQREPGADLALVAHTDRGSQYTSADYTQTLADHDVLASVGTVGDAYDNAMAESFVDTFKTELIADRVWRSRSQLQMKIGST
jgi:transposase InsO family protein